jgi:regulator of extracellular matrix RemA (YlzA/DUF370 family)
MTEVLHVGFYNYVTAESVVALIDYKLAAAKKIIKSAKDEKPRSVMDVTRGRKAQTLIVLVGDRYLISAIYRKQLAKRLSPLPEEEQDEIFPPLAHSSGTQEEILLDGTGETSRSKRKITQT